jgi:hypothetical protein
MASPRRIESAMVAEAKVALRAYLDLCLAS